jgi:hypothetical protein
LEIKGGLEVDIDHTMETKRKQKWEVVVVEIKARHIKKCNMAII